MIVVAYNRGTAHGNGGVACCHTRAVYVREYLNLVAEAIAPASIIDYLTSICSLLVSVFVVGRLRVFSLMVRRCSKDPNATLDLFNLTFRLTRMSDRIPDNMYAMRLCSCCVYLFALIVQRSFLRRLYVHTREEELKQCLLRSMRFFELCYRHEVRQMTSRGNDPKARAARGVIWWGNYNKRGIECMHLRG